MLASMITRLFFMMELLAALNAIPAGWGLAGVDLYMGPPSPRPRPGSAAATSPPLAASPPRAHPGQELPKHSLTRPTRPPGRNDTPRTWTKCQPHWKAAPHTGYKKTKSSTKNQILGVFFPITFWPIRLFGPVGKTSGCPGGHVCCATEHGSNFRQKRKNTGCFFSVLLAFFRYGNSREGVFPICSDLFRFFRRGFGQEGLGRVEGLGGYRFC